MRLLFLLPLVFACGPLPPDTTPSTSTTSSTNNPTGTGSSSTSGGPTSTDSTGDSSSTGSSSTGGGSTSSSSTGGGSSTGPNTGNCPNGWPPCGPECTGALSECVVSFDGSGWVCQQMCAGGDCPGVCGCVDSSDCWAGQLCLASEVGGVALCMWPKN